MDLLRRLLDDRIRSMRRETIVESRRFLELSAEAIGREGLAMRRSCERLLERLDAAVAESGGDWAVRMDTGAEAAWAAEVRVTADPNVRGAPDRSIAFYQAGGRTAESALELAILSALDEVAGWDPDRVRPPTWTDG